MHHQELGTIADVLGPHRVPRADDVRRLDGEDLERQLHSSARRSSQPTCARRRVAEVQDGATRRRTQTGLRHRRRNRHHGHRHDRAGASAASITAGIALILLLPILVLALLRARSSQRRARGSARPASTAGFACQLYPLARRQGSGRRCPLDGGERRRVVDELPSTRRGQPATASGKRGSADENPLRRIAHQEGGTHHEDQ